MSLGAQNSRSKDLFDLYHLLQRVNPVLLKRAISETFGFRGDKVPDSFYDYFSNLDFRLLKQGWTSAVSSLDSPPSFELCREYIVGWFKNMGNA